MKAIFTIILIILSLFLMSCVSAPKETVELSEIIGNQISEMQASHEKFVHLFYDKLREDVDNFLTKVWIPRFMSNVIEGKGEASRQFRKDLDTAYKLSRLDWGEVVQIKNIQDNEIKEAIEASLKRLTEEQNANLGMVLIDFASGAQAEINKQRRKMMDPINEQEAYVLEELRDGYADLQRGSAAIKGYLAATVKLVEERDAVLDQLGVLETQKKIIKTATNLSDEAVKALDKVEDIDEGIGKFLETMEKIQDTIEKIKKED